MSISNPLLSESLFSELPGILYRCRIINDVPLLTNISPGVVELTGYSVEKILREKTTSFYDIIHPDDKERVYKEHRNFSRTGTDLTTQYRIIDSNGMIRWVKEIAVSDYNGNEPFHIDGYVMDITGKKQFAEVVKTLRAYQLALNESAIVSLTDKQGKIIYANEKFIETSKYNREELIGKTHQVVNSSHHPNDFFKQMWETILSGSHWRGEIKNRAKDGTHYWVDTVITPVLNENREITQFLSVRNIITIQKEQEEILRANEEKFRDLIENTSDLIQSVDANGQIVFVNESWKKRLGYTDEEVIGKNIFNFIHPANRSHCETIFELIKNGEEVRSVEVAFLSADGEQVFCEANINARFDNYQMVLSRGIFRDVTEARKYRAMLQRERAQLKSAQQMAKLGSWFFDVKNNILEWSDEARRIFDIPLNKKPTTNDFIEKVHPEDVDFVVKTWQDAMKGEKYDIEHRLLINGKEKWIRVLAVVSFNEQNEPLHSNGSVQDITEKKKTEIKLLRKQQQLNEAQKIAKVASYEWNTETNELHCSSEMFTILGLKKTKKPILFDEIFLLVHPEDRSFVAEKLAASKKTRTAFSVQFRCITPDGTIKYLEGKRQKPAAAETDHIYFKGTMQDISSFKQFEKELFNSIIESEENERNRIAAELHDGVCQYLAAGKLIIETIRSMASSEKPELKALIEDCYDVVNESFQVSRHISHQLVPQSLYDNGFLESLHEMINLLNKVDNKRYRLSVSGIEKEPESHIAVNLYRIIQEFTRNSQKYSEADKIKINVHYTESAIEIELSDNGKGFDLDKVKEQKGIGIFNMINRIESIGGNYSFTSKPGNGVLLKIHTVLAI